MSHLFKGLVVLFAMLSLAGCSPNLVRQPGIRSYGATQPPQRPVLTPGGFATDIAATNWGQAFRYRDGAGSDQGMWRANSEQLRRQLTAKGFAQNRSMEFLPSNLGRVFQVEKQMNGTFTFECEGECSDVMINVQCNCRASLGMMAQFPIVWFTAPTYWGSAMYLRIANPEDLSGQHFRLKVSLWQQ